MHRLLCRKTLRIHLLASEERRLFEIPNHVVRHHQEITIFHSNDSNIQLTGDIPIAGA